MSIGANLKLLGDWKAKAVTARLDQALAMSVDVMGRTGIEACKHAMILMAKSARANAIKSKTRRPVLSIGAKGKNGYAQYVEAWNQASSKPNKLYKWQFSDSTLSVWRIPGTWENAKKIANHGLASRSWMWGLKRLNAGAESQRSGIPGVATLYPIARGTVGGFVLENKLSYIQKAMPSGWEQMVEASATNQIMAQSAKKMGKAWASAVERGGESLALRTLNDYVMTEAA